MLIKRLLISILIISFFDIAHSLVRAQCDGSDLGKAVVIVIPSFNNKAWYKKNLASVWQQRYNNFRVIYVDDCSTDGTADLVSAYVAAHEHHFDFKLIRNPKRRGPLANYYSAIHSCHDYEIIFCLDGDDFIAHENVLSVIDDAYQADPTLLMTYGNRLTYLNPKRRFPWGKRYSPEVERNNDYRLARWAAPHPFTFYAGFFKKIRLEDFLYGDAFMEAVTDQAIIIPLLEMAGGHYHFFAEYLYIWNNTNPISEFRIRPQLEEQNGHVIRTRQRYRPLTEQERATIVQAS